MCPYSWTVLRSLQICSADCGQCDCPVPHGLQWARRAQRSSDAPGPFPTHPAEAGRRGQSSLSRNDSSVLPYRVTRWSTCVRLPTSKGFLKPDRPTCKIDTGGNTGNVVDTELFCVCAGCDIHPFSVQPCLVTHTRLCLHTLKAVLNAVLFTFLKFTPAINSYDRSKYYQQKKLMIEWS